MHEITDVMVHGQDLHKTKPINTPAWIEEGFTKTPLLAKKLLAADGY